MKLIILTIVVVVSFATGSFANQNSKKEVLNQKKELEQIVKQVDSSQRRLDSLRDAEASLQKQISDYDQRITSDRKVIRRLSGQLNDIKAGVSEAEGNLSLRQTEFERTRRRYLGNIRQTYFSLQDSLSLTALRPNGELEARRQVVYLVALAGFQAGNVQQANAYLDNAVSELEGLTGQRNLVTDLKKKREVSYAIGRSKKEKQQRSLDRVKMRKQDEADRMLTLRQAAAEMETIIARLEAEQARGERIDVSGGISAFTTMKGQMGMPFRGKVVVPFGPSEDPVTKLKSFSPGIVIAGSAGGRVISVASGTVAYTGSLRGYGNFVIIRHDRQYYTTYAGLGATAVAEGQFLQTGSQLGRVSDEGRLRFELRRGRDALDPVEWIKIEAL
jgi:septal ring factor EnvC (AmiA/AmiB activator)